MTNLSMTATKKCPYDARERRAKKLGWKFVDNRSCPLRLVGKRCRGYTRCWCTHNGDHYHGLNDHGATWIDNKGSKFVLWEPYAAGGCALAEVIRAAAEDGIEVRIKSSVWNPPSTVGIAFYRSPEPTQKLRKLGWTVEDDGGQNKENTAKWTIVPPAHVAEAEVGSA